MGIFRGLGVVNDGLVFGYDTGYPISDNAVTNRFNQGEPTVNHVTDSIVQISGFGGSYSLLDSATKSFQLNINSFNSSGQTWRSFMWDMRSHAGSAVTISATIEVPSDSPGDFAWVMMGQANSLSNGTQAATYLGYSATSERYYKSTTNTERITWSGTIGNTGTANQPNGIIGFTVWYNGGTNGTNCFIKVSNVQIEKIAHETPFVNGTRSDTASLIDLKRTRDIDVSNVSFDSTGQLEFDGTDDYISITNLLNSESIGASTNLTISMWLNPSTHSHDMPFSTGQTGSDRVYYWTVSNLNTWRVGNYTSTSGHGTLPSIGTWYNTVLVIDGTSITVYLNGEEDYTGSYSAFTTADYATFGKHGTHSGAYRYNGKIAVARIYDQSLTAAEIKQNYNAYKNRFNI